MSIRDRWREWRTSQNEDDAVAREMQFHIEQETARNQRFGMSASDARREALRAFGGVDRFGEQARDERPGTAWTDLNKDLRYAFRWLRNSPGFAIVAILTLALGIGATTAIFSVVNGALLRPLPFTDPDRIVKVSLSSPDEPDMVWSYPKYEMLRDQQRVFSDIAGYSDWTGNLAGQGEPERLRGERVTARYFQVLGVRLLHGRSFSEDEARDPNVAQVVVLSDALWRRRFNADPTVVGQTIRIDNSPVTVVGVVAGNFRGLTGVADVFVPMSTIGVMLSREFAHFMEVTARLNAGVTLERAAGDVSIVGKRIAEAYRSPRDNVEFTAVARSLEELRLDPAIRRSVLVLFGAVSGVLLIACANVANLLLARATGRRREIAVRIALGAGRYRLIRQLLTESLALTLVGGALGVLLAWGAVRGFNGVLDNAGSVFGRRIGGFSVISLANIKLDASVLLFALAASVLTGLLFGAIPALHATRPDLTDDLKQGGAATLGALGIKGFTARNALIVAEVAIAFMMLVGSGLMLSSLLRLLRTDAGVDPRNLLTVQISLPESTSPDAAQQFWQQLLQQTAALPGVGSAAIADCPPLIGRCNVRPLWPNGPQSGAPVPVGVHYVTPDYFTALRARIVEGRVFRSSDRAGTPHVVVINQSAAQKYFPAGDAIGKRVGVAGGFADGAEIIGVVGDQRFAAIETPPEPDVYIAYDQVPQRSGYLFLRSAGSPTALTASVRRAVQDIDPTLPIFDVQTMEQRVAGASARTRVTGVLLGVFASIALLLAMIGIYGVVAFAVAQRTREIGLRVALGAARADVIKLILPYGAGLIGLGLVLGLFGAWGTTRLLRSLLYEIKPTDPAVFVTLIVATLLAGAAACGVPVVRATRVDPLIALKAD